MSVQTAPVLADLLPGERVKDAALVVGGAGLLAIASQISIPLGFTPVPLSLATFAVLLMGAALGPVRSGLSTGLFILLGVAGIPVFAGFGTGWAFASFGYVLGYFVAAVVAGALARRYADRRVVGTLTLAVVGSALIYAIGVPWLMASLGVGLADALLMGVVPFLLGDAIKAVAAGALLPFTWKVIERFKG